MKEEIERTNIKRCFLVIVVKGGREEGNFYEK